MILGRSKTPRTKDKAQPRAAVPTAPKYEKPKILLVDMPGPCTNVLRAAGYNVTTGSFGTPYCVDRSDNLGYVSVRSFRLPDYEEQEIVLVNTTPPDATSEKPTDVPGEGVEALWQSCKSGTIDPRPFAMHMVGEAFDKIHQHGGVFVVVLGEPYQVHYTHGAQSRFYGIERHREYDCSSSCFPCESRLLGMTPAHGRELVFAPPVSPLASLLRKGAQGSYYECAVDARRDKGKWLPLITNKYGDALGGLFLWEKPRGPLLVLPQMPGLHTVLVELLEVWCAEWSPALFPHIEGARWVHRPEYEVPGVVELQKQRQRIDREAQERIEELEEQIDKAREMNQDWYTLLRGTGSELVDAVIHSLNSLGFADVRNMDAVAEQEGAGRTLREDIQVHDRSPVLIIDVKGITGCPEDAESAQAEKHATMRMREWDRTDVKGLSIINHQRNLPPADRDPKAYRDEIIGNAEETGLGLMTTWDLWRILRNKEGLGWPDQAVRPIFYRAGRIEPIPEHYVAIAQIVHVWKDAFGIIPTQGIQTGDTLAIEVGDVFEEMKVESLQVNDGGVAAAPAGSNCGVGCPGAVERFREGIRVFLVSQRG